MASTAQFLIRINAQLPWRFTIAKGGNYVAVCDPLKITVQAPTWVELMEDTADVLNSIFRDLLNSNELENFLQSHGWSMMGQPPQRQENVRFDVPFLFVPEMAQHNGSQGYLPQ